MDILKTTEVVTDFYHMDVTDILFRDSTKKVSLVRNMAYYILHTKGGFSISKIARLFGRTERGIKQRIANTKYLVETQKVYQDEYKAIVKNIK